MGHQVGFKETRLRVIPFGECTNGNAAFEKAPGAGEMSSLEAVLCPFGGQKPIDGGGTDRGEQLDYLAAQAQGRCNSGSELLQKRGKTFTAQAVESVPQVP